MIEITRIKNEQGENIGFRCLGHAGFARHGKDIVCAAVSTLVQTLAWSIKDLTEDTIEYEVSSEGTKIQYENLSERSKLLVDSFFIGILEIAREYPKHVEIV